MYVIVTVVGHLIGSLGMPWAMVITFEAIGRKVRDVHYAIIHRLTSHLKRMAKKSVRERKCITFSSSFLVVFFISTVKIAWIVPNTIYLGKMFFFCANRLTSHNNIKKFLFFFIHFIVKKTMRTFVRSASFSFAAYISMRREILMWKWIRRDQDIQSHILMECWQLVLCVHVCVCV